MSGWSQPICEACWIQENGEWEFYGVTETGALQTVLKHVRMPVLKMSRSLEICCMCGEITIMGIWIRRNPDTVPFPDTSEAVAAQADGTAFQGDKPCE